MPQDGSSNYQYPPGTRGIPDQTIESEAYNTFLDDLVTHDLNIPRPIHRGGTGADNATQALVNLGGEKSSQVVTNYDTQVFLSGSFYSAVGATNAPVAGHAFVGIAYSSDPPATPPANLNVIIEARDQNDTSAPGGVYIREKKAGVWGAWRSSAQLIVGQLPPVGAPDGALFWDSDNGVLYVNYNDGNSIQWVQAVALPSVDTTVFVQRGGDTMTGLLTLSGEPTANLHAATKLYVDAGVGGVGGGLASKIGKAGGADGIMTGFLTLSADPDAAMKAATKQYVDAKFVLRSYLAGLALSTGGSSTTFGVAAGVAANSTSIAMLTLASAYTKTTAAWALGSGNGSLDTGTIAANTWYHVYLIQRIDTGVVDVAVSASAIAVTLPSPYTLFRRIGSMKTNASLQWVKFSQIGDEFLWDISVLDASGFTGSVAPRTLTLSVPTGIQVSATIDTLGYATGGAPYDGRFLISPLDVADETLGLHFNLGVYGAMGAQACDQMHVRTSTSGQIRVKALDVGASLYLSTVGWMDRRGRDI